jgi:hypothetical protein
MAKHLSSRGLTNRLSLTSGRWIRRTQGGVRAGGQGWPKNVRNPGAMGPDPRFLHPPMQFIRKQ